MAKPRMAYTLIRSGVDQSGWFKFYLRRRDGREIKVSRARMADLRRQGRIQGEEVTERKPLFEGSCVGAGL